MKCSCCPRPPSHPSSSSALPRGGPESGPLQFRWMTFRVNELVFAEGSDDLVRCRRDARRCQSELLSRGRSGSIHVQSSYDVYGNELPFLVHPLPIQHPPQIQHPPPIRRAIARMRRKARKKLVSGEGMGRRMHDQRFITRVQLGAR